VKHDSRLGCARFLPAAVLFLPGLAWAQQPQYNISTVAGNGTDGYSGDNAAANQAELSDPCGIAVDSTGNIYIADQNNNRIRKAVPGGNITTAIGNGTAGFTGDGGSPTQAEIMAPCGVAVDAAGDIYVSQTDSNGSTASAIRELAGGNLNTVAGGNSSTPLGPGYTGDGGPAANAQLNNPSALVLDSSGNLYIADTQNNVIRLITPDGNITTVAGNGNAKYGGDGLPPTRASLNRPEGLAVDPAGNLYIADTHNYCVRAVKNGVINTIAGICGTTGFSGDNGPATKAMLNYPTDVKVDAAGNIYIVDSFNFRIRMISPNGTISTIAGNGSVGAGGDGGPAAAAQLNFPQALALGPLGVIYISDRGNNEIRMLTPVLPPPAIDHAQSVSSCGAFPAAAAPGAWIEIYGSNLAVDARTWALTDFTGAGAPTSLDGTVVTIGGQNAVLSYISSGQINAQVPPGVSPSSQVLVARTAAGTSASYTLTINATEPGLCQGLTVGGKPYLVAVINDTLMYILPSSANVSGIAFRPAHPGEVISFFGNGFGAVTPAPAPDQLVGRMNMLSNSFQVQMGGVTAAIDYAGLALQAIGLYQFNLVVPNIPDGDAVPVTFSLGGVASSQTLYTAVHQ
jgi:uncharacterized protein (TIGR03437 family)